jgi:hypothetical protein
MPKGKQDYSNTLIIKIVFKNAERNECIIDYTTGLINKIQLFKKQYNNPEHKNYNCEMFNLMRENDGWAGVDVLILEEYKECTNKSQALMRVREWKLKMKDTNRILIIN